MSNWKVVDTAPNGATLQCDGWHYACVPFCSDPEDFDSWIGSSVAVDQFWEVLSNTSNGLWPKPEEDYWSIDDRILAEHIDCVYGADPVSESNNEEF